MHCWIKCKYHQKPQDMNDDIVWLNIGINLHIIPDYLHEKHINTEGF